MAQPAESQVDHASRIAAINRVLDAEAKANAERVRCDERARAIVTSARERARRLAARAEARIQRLHQFHDDRAEHNARNIERERVRILQESEAARVDDAEIEAVTARLVGELLAGEANA